MKELTTKNHIYKVGEKVYLGMDGRSDTIIELVPAEGGCDILAYILQEEGYIFESSINYSESEYKGEIK